MASSAAPSPVRALHWVFKIGDRTATHKFLSEQLGMEVLRHEEFTEGCDAACNGPYDGLWSKTMIGYGDESANFVLELTYNYGLKHYDVGNDYGYITINSREAYKRVAASGAGQSADGNGALLVRSPDGYAFKVVNSDAPACGVVSEITLNVTDLQRSLAYWSGFLNFKVQSQGDKEASLVCGERACALRLVQLPAGQAMNHGTGYGRIAFACPGPQLQPLEAAVRAAGHTVLTPFVSLDTPGKATVQVVILADPDGHEICFVNEDGFSDLSRRDPAGASLLAAAMETDKSGEWYAQRQAYLAELDAREKAQAAAS